MIQGWRNVMHTFVNIDRIDNSKDLQTGQMHANWDVGQLCAMPSLNRLCASVGLIFNIYF